jgi:hypothetical protein
LLIDDEENDEVDDRRCKMEEDEDDGEKGVDVGIFVCIGYPSI